MSTTEATTTDGVRLLSHRPSVLYKVEHLATEPADGDIAVEGLKLAGPGWDDRLKTLLQSLSQSERACLFAVRLADEQALPLPAETLLDRARTDWFPEFLSHGLMRPHFQPIVELTTGRSIGREALMRGKLGAVEVRGGELLAAAEAHDALYSFDARARAAALEVGLPLLPDGEILFVNVDPRAALDVESSLRTTWPVVGRLNADPSRICLEIVRPERCADRELLAAAEAHDALFSFDYRARTAALEVGLPLLPDGEVLFVNLDPRAVLDVEGSLRTTWPAVGRLGADPSRICLELVKPERCADRDMLGELVAAHRKRGARVALDDMSGGAESLLFLEQLRPDVVKIDNALTAGIQHSPARRRLVAALVDCAHEHGCKVVAEGVERVDEFRAMADLGVDLGQGFYFGQPTEKPMAVDTRLVRPSAY